jgi:hypothetical protein
MSDASYGREQRYCIIRPACTCSLMSTGTRSAFQISAQYSRMLRSEEKRPERAVFRIYMRVQCSISR